MALSRRSRLDQRTTSRVWYQPVVVEFEEATAQLAPLIARARTECPEITVSDDAFVAHLKAVGSFAELGTFDNLHAGDLLIAAGCVQNHQPALTLFDQRFAPDLRQALRAIDGSASFLDEVLQELRCKLFVADGDALPRITRYSGKGALGGWLRVAALREAISKRRKTWREVPAEAGLAMLPHAGRSPEQDLAFQQHEAALQTALRAAVAAQTSRSRALLRYYYCDRVGVEELGKIYRVHASTASRWLAQARDEILAETRRRLAQALRQNESQVESALGLAGGLEVSLDSLLRSTSSDA
jgi:RNA polymerase sigma-70 factor (ECF subfamily)